MQKTIFILGGARSGKSNYAVGLAKKLRKKTAFIATCVAWDDEMRERIRKHKAERPRHWKVIEEGRDIHQALTMAKSRYEIILVDCLGLWISNLLADGWADEKIEKQIGKLIKAISKGKGLTILVSNEVGSGIVPDNPLARRFRDLLGIANQMVAGQADEVVFMQSGIAMVIKGGRDGTFDQCLKQD